MARKPAIAKADELVGGLLALAEKNWLVRADVDGLLKPLRVDRDLEAEIYVLRELTEIARVMPLKLFADLESRERLIDAIQEALDDAVSREEEQEESA
jgi:type III secretion protein W